MKVLIIGGGGREHTLAWKISQSPLLSELFAIPGNPGMEQVACCVELKDSSPHAIAAWAVQNGIDLAVVGPEAPLAEGVVDAFEEKGLKIFGPTRTAAELEASKSFAKEIMVAAGVKTARSEIFSDFDKARSYVEKCGAPIVIKADGLAAGKGVTVAMSLDTAIGALEECLLGNRFGDSGARVVVEDYLQGQEASVMAIIDGDDIAPLVVSQDYKRLQNDDQGPNTGGMGAISPTPVVKDIPIERFVEEVFRPTVSELSKRGIRYRGFLYAGMMLSPGSEASVLEFNCRLGDPETQVLLTRLKSDLLEHLHAAVSGSLSSQELLWTEDAAACVVASSAGYPLAVDDGKFIESELEDRDDCRVFFAGVRKDDHGRLLTKGGRVLAVSALGETVEAALDKAYAGMSKLSFDGMHFRTDIGRTGSVK